MILERIVQRVVHARVEAGETLPLAEAKRIAAQYQMPVTFDFNQDKFIVHPNGEVHRMNEGRWRQVASAPNQPEADMPTKIISKCWIFASSSGSGTYETLLYTDGSTSCACMGWCRRVQPNGTRTCKHVRSVDMGRADDEALSVHDYRTIFPLTTPPKQQTRKEPHAKKKSGSGSPSPTGYGKRRLIL